MDYILECLQKLLPEFKIANAVIHFDEASPHMHVVGVPVWEGAKRGLSKKVSKRNVFTPQTLSVILQDKLREEASYGFEYPNREGVLLERVLEVLKMPVVLGGYEMI